MSFLDKLKNLFETDIGDILSNNNITLINISTNSSKPIEVKDSNTLSVDLKKLNSEQKIRIKEIVDSSVQDEEIPFLTVKSVEKVRQLKRNLLKSADDELLEFYRDKINPEMHRAFEMSLIVRNSFRNSEDITELKKDITYKFPDFGNNICNLTTSNYFDVYFKELFNTMKEEKDFDINKYKNEIERIIIELPYMVFINRYKSLEEFSGEVKFKLEKFKKYGTNKFKLHAIGNDNVRKSLSIADEYNGQLEFNIERDVNSSETISTITFNF